MQNKRSELNNLSTTLDRVENEISSAQVPVLQAQNSSLRTLSFLQSQRLNNQTQFEHSQSQLATQQNANRIISDRLADLQAQNSSLQTLSSLQSQRLNSQTQFEHSQNQLATQQNANRTIFDHLTDLQRYQNDLSREAHIKQDILNLLRGVMQNNRAIELEGVMLENSNTMARNMSPEDISRASLIKDSCLKLCKESFDAVISRLTNIEDLNMQDQDGKTILMHAAENGFYYGVEKLLERGVDVNIVDHKGANALIYSAMMPHIKWTEVIAGSTNNINHKTNEDFVNGSSALHILVINTNTIWFGDEILENSSEYRVQSNFRGKSFDFVNGTLTIKGNVTLNQWNSNGIHLESNLESMTIRSSARSSDGYTSNQEKIKVLIARLVDFGSNINEQDSRGMTPLFLACKGTHTYLVRKIFEQYQDRIDFALKDANDNSYLHYIAVVPNSIEVMQAVIAKNITSVNTQNIGGGTPIAQSVMSNNIGTLELLMNHGANINILENEGFHPWHLASQYGALDSMKFLKNWIPQIIDLRTNKDVNALHLASRSGHLQIVKWLVTEGADINAKMGQHNLTSFFLACSSKRADVAEYLLNHQRFDNTVVDSLGYGSLHWALEFKSIDWIEKVLSKGNININHTDLNGLTALSWGASYNLPQIVELLVNRGANINIATKFGGFPIHQAAAHGALEAIRILVTLGSNINQQDTLTSKVTPLWCAARARQQEVTQWLIDQHADINAKDFNSGMTPLHIAILNRDDNIAHLLVDRGADITTARTDGHNAYTLACGATKPAAQPFNAPMRDLAIRILNMMSSEHLLDAVGDRTILSWTVNLNSPLALQILEQKLGVLQINEDNPNSNTAINWAIYNLHSNSLNWLKDHGADINKQDAQGLTYLHKLSLKIDQVAQLKFALDNGVSPDSQTIDGLTPFFMVCNVIALATTEEQKIVTRDKGKSALLTLLAANPDMLIKDYSGQGYFAWGLESRDPEILQNILNHGADINSRDNKGLSTLYWATKYKWVDMTAWLLNHGADINLATTDGSTPLHEALSNTSYDLDLVKTLIEFRADPNVPNLAGKTPLDLARDNCPEVIEWFEHAENLPILPMIGVGGHFAEDLNA